MAKEKNVKGFKSDEEAREFKIKLLQAGDLLRVNFTITPWVGRFDMKNKIERKVVV